MKRWYSIKAKAKDAEIWIYEEIGDFWDGGVSAKEFAKELKAVGKVDTINLHLNSPGGVVTDGIAIYNLLRQNQARINVHIEGWAASIASVVAMAGDEINMAENGLMMIHDPWGLAIGNSAEMRAAADILDKMKDSILMAYVKKAGKEEDEKKFADLMAAETWMNAQEALNHGLIDNITDSIKMAASFDLSKFKYHNIPEQFKPGNMDCRQRLARQSMTCHKIRAASGRN